MPVRGQHRSWPSGRQRFPAVAFADLSLPRLQLLASLLLAASAAFLAPLPAIAAAAAAATFSNTEIVGGCDAATFRYPTIEYLNPNDCRTYTLYGVDAHCLPDWLGAKQICEQSGLELASVNETESAAALRVLCAANRFTCWLGGVKVPIPGTPVHLCPLMDAAGEVHEQDCRQHVRFVCRGNADPAGSGGNGCAHNQSTAPAVPMDPTAPSAPALPGSPRPPPSFGNCYAACRRQKPWVNPYIKYCDKYDNRYEDLCWAQCLHAEAPVRCSMWVPPPPPPPSPPSQSPATRSADVSAVTRGSDIEDDPNVPTLIEGGFEYRLYDRAATMRVPYAGAATFCASLWPGWDLVPYTDSVAFNIVRRLCAANLFTCWLKRADGAEVDGGGDGDCSKQLCPLMAADGMLQLQDCDQDVRFVCRRGEP